MCIPTGIYIFQNIEAWVIFAFMERSTPPVFTKDQKVAHVTSWQSSGMTQKEYSLAHGLNYSTFKNWLKRYRKNNGSAISREPGTFIPVTSPTEKNNAGNTSGIRIDYPNGVTITCTGGVNADFISKLIKHY